MRDLNENNIIEAVLEQVRDTPDPRLKQIMASLVRHLHGFVRDVEPTFEEWNRAIVFLTRTGQMCSDTRQEFILLSDTLGVSMLVDALNHRMPEGATPTTVLGPFYVANAPEMALGADISGGLAGEPLYVEGSVASAAGRDRLAGAIVDIWHSDSEGYYDVQRPDLDHSALRGRFLTDADGRFRFWSIMPSSYPVPNDGPVGRMLAATGRHPYRPAHVHFMISADGHETLVTHVFVAGDPYLDSDAVFGVKDALIREYAPEPPGMAPDGKTMREPWRRLSYDFALKPRSPARAAR